MVTPLHDIDALVSLADGEDGPARDWATSRLAVQAPDRYQTFPSSLAAPDVLLAAGPPQLIASITGALDRHEPPSPTLATVAAHLGTYGMLPDSEEPLVSVLRAALRRDGSESDLWLVQALCAFGAAGPAELVEATKVRSPETIWMLPAIVLDVAWRNDRLKAAARAVAAELRPRLEDDPELLGGIVTALGCPSGESSLALEPEEAARGGARLGGGDLPDLAIPRGNRTRRLQGWVVGLLEDVRHPAAALLAELFRKDPHPAWGSGYAAVAGWLHAFRRGDDPVEDVLERHAGSAPHVLSDARRAVRPSDRDRILHALSLPTDRAISVLAVPLVQRGDEELGDAVLERFLEGNQPDLRTEVAACACAWSRADRLPDLLRSPTLQTHALVLAEWAPTVEVLDALLRIDVPYAPTARILYGRCLAAMGDAAALPRLQALIAHDEDGVHDESKALAEALLLTSLDP